MQALERVQASATPAHLVITSFTLAGIGLLASQRRGSTCSKGHPLLPASAAADVCGQAQLMRPTRFSLHLAAPRCISLHLHVTACSACICLHLPASACISRCGLPLAGFILQPSCIPSGDAGWEAVEHIETQQGALRLLDALERRYFTS